MKLITTACKWLLAPFTRSSAPPAIVEYPLFYWAYSILPLQTLLQNGSVMAGAQRYLLNRDGRFFARLVVPKELRGIVGKSELRTPLGPDRRGAIKLLPTAVAAMQAEIIRAKREAHPDQPSQFDPFTTADYGRAVWQRYTAALAEDEAKRDSLPTSE